MTSEEALNSKEGRVARRQRRNRAALIRAASAVMSEKGIDAATMAEIADRADVGAGTVYNYFRSKEELAFAVLEEIVQDLALRVQTATRGESDPAHVYAVTLRTALETALRDARWRQVPGRSGVVADVMFRRMGPLAIDLLTRARDNGTLDLDDPILAWRITTHAVVGISLTASRGELDDSALQEAARQLLCLTGMSAAMARDLLARPRPALPPAQGHPVPAADPLA